MVRFLAVGALQRLPHLLLPRMVGRHPEGHELLERHAVFGIDVEQLLGHRGKPQSLLHHINAHEEGCRDVLLGLVFLAHGLESAELIERMQRRALDIFGEAVLLRDAAFAHDAGDGGGLRQSLLLHEEFERAVATAAGGDLEHPGFIAVGVAHRPHGEALQERAPRDILGESLDRDARLDPPDVGLAEEELVEGDVPRRTQDDLLNLGHGRSP